jgi:hypothetical protein
MPIEGVGFRSSASPEALRTLDRRQREWAADAGCFDTRQLAHARDGVLIEGRPTVDRGEHPKVQRDPGGDDVRGIEADRRLEKVDEGTQH